MNPDTYDAGSPGPSGARGKSKKRRFRLGRDRAELITDARLSPSQDRRRRERAYAWIQGSRIPFLLLSAVTFLWWENWWISAVLFTISVPLPWIAVVIANGHGEPHDKRSQQVYKPAVAREYNQQLELEAAQRAAELAAGPVTKEISAAKNDDDDIIIIDQLPPDTDSTSTS
ncbi:DUF3099 domain-containing protein [Corynebacterium alimapuense]|uniref:DUF3099 domain-containing protein n=1 Tax=Corynebacterium alimapuense TaxID=1576874 RepID=A0A3M8K813_9CORY|nr:DUF3099 domain-containing protein [Corynebacterium alimapuense]RNE49300.1 DUF3099 domain-containing protein [Corynebacterium alimapuense]